MSSRDFARGDGFGAVEVQFCGAPQALQTGEDIAAVNGKATDHEAVSWLAC